MPIQSFKDPDAETLHQTGKSRRYGNIAQTARRKLDMLDAAVELKDLASPPGNRLEALSGDRAEQHSIRINEQWRICFVWTAVGPARVEITDYH